MTSRLRRLAFLTLALLGAEVGAAPEAPSPEVLERRMAEVRATLQRLLRNETSVGEELERWDRRVREAEATWAEAQREADEAEGLLDELRKVESDARSAIEKRGADLGERLRFRYRLERRGGGPLWLSATSHAEARRTQRALDRLLAAEVEALEETEAAVEALAGIQARMEGVEREARAAADAARLRMEELLAEREARASLLASLREERRLQEQVLRELEDAQRRLSQEVARLAAHRAEKEALTRALGELRWPLDGAVVELGFGRVVDAKFQTVTHHRGLDLRAPEGSPVLAAARGRVVYSGWFRGFGNLVIVDHGAGYHSLYGHLGSLERAVDDEVEVGDVLGTLGDTGSLKGPYLYFELRRQGQAIDPLSWLP